MKYLRIPSEITLADLRASGASLSAAMYKRVDIPNPNVKRVRELIQGYDKGEDPGSRHYLKRSTHYFIRTRALQSHSWLLYPKGGAITPISPKVFQGSALRDGDILMSKDSNIGECAMVHGDGWTNHMLSAGVVRIKPKIDAHYLFAFMKHELFRAELATMVPRGSTIAHANEHWLECRIPFPSQTDAQAVMNYVSAAARAILDKEAAIRTKVFDALQMIDDEIDGVNPECFTYEFPNSKGVMSARRMDAGFWSPALQFQLHRLRRYRGGAWASIYDAGYRTRRGPNLAVSVAGVGHYGDEPFGNAMPMATPGDLSDFMTIPRFRFYGNRRPVDTVRKGEMLFAGKGVREVSIGHTWVNLNDAPFVTNFDSFLISAPDITDTIVLAFFFNYLKEKAVFAKLSDTSNGGSFVQSHFDALPIPKFPRYFKSELARLYHNPAPPPRQSLTLANFVSWHREWNTSLGIWELDRELKMLQMTLREVQDAIIEGREVPIPITP